MIITLGGQAYTLRPTFKALLALEEASGTGLISLARRFAEGSFTLADAEAVLRAGIEGAGQVLPANLGGLMVTHGLTGLAPLLTQFLICALSGDDDTGKGLAASGSTGPS